MSIFWFAFVPERFKIVFTKTTERETKMKVEMDKSELLIIEDIFADLLCESRHGSWTNVLGEKTERQYQAIIDNINNAIKEAEEK